MKILMLITSLGVGGAERLVSQLADAFVAGGHEVMLVWLVGEAELQPSDARVRMVPLHMSKNPLAGLASARQLRRLIREFAPDVVNSHLVHANLLARLMRITTPMPRLVSSAHNTNEEGRLRMLAYRLTDRLADISTNVSQAAVRAFVDQGAVRPERMVAVDNGIDVEAFVFDGSSRKRLRNEWGLAETDMVLLAVGRLWASKDYPNLLSALALLKEQGRCPRLLIVGDGPLREPLIQRARSLGLGPQVRFLGLRRDVPALLSAADVFVLPSAWEGFGLVVAEAMACERVVVATDTGGVRELVGDAGRLVLVSDSEALADGIAWAINLSDEEYVRYGQMARSRIVSRYSLQATAERYMAIFQGRSTS